MAKLLGEMVVCACCDAESGVICPDAGEGEVPRVLLHELSLRSWVRNRYSGLWLCDECGDPDAQRREDERTFWRDAF